MDLITVGYLMIASLGVLLLIGTPIGLALAASGIGGLFLTRGGAAVEFLLGSFSYSYTANYAFIVIPLFLFMGQVAFTSGISQKAYSAAEKLLGHLPGGLAIATTFGCAAFAMISGSSVATASTMARIAVPEMLKRNYAPTLAAGCVAAGGTLGVLIPPSGVLVIYAIATQVSLVDLFVAALVPGFMTAAIYAASIYIFVKIKPELAGGGQIVQAPLRDRIVTIAGSWEILALFGIVMGSIYMGIATPTEAAAVGALATVLLAFRRPREAMPIFGRALRETGTSTASIFVLILGSGIFSLGLSTTQLPVIIADWVMGLSDSRYVLLLLILIPYLILGMFIDGISMILLTMPITYPIIVQLGFDPVWFGIIVTKLVEIGLITPPVGLNVFVVKGAVPGLTLNQVFRGCFPFVIIELLIVGLLIAVPELTMFGRGN